MRGKYMRKLICCMLVAMMGVAQSFHRRQIFPAWLPSPGFPLF